MRTSIRLIALAALMANELIGVATGAWVMAGYMAVFGLGLGFVMQVLVVAVQNAVPMSASPMESGGRPTPASCIRSVRSSFALTYR